MSQQTQWVEPSEGFEYRSDSVVVEADYQREKLQACGIDPALYGDCVDPSFYIGLAIHAGINSGISAEGNVNMLQSLVQHRPAQLDESLTVHGRITAVTQVPRGRTIDSDVWFEDSSGKRVITARRRSLKPDPAKAGVRGAGERPAPVVDDVEALNIVASHQLTPESVIAYSSEGNSIHYDMDAAVAAGFRAPLIGGGMGVHYLLAHLWAADRRSSLDQLDLDIYFRRPIFWDEAFSVATDGDRAIALIKTDAGVRKVLTEARINLPSPSK